MAYIRIFTEDEDKFNAAVEALKPIGVEAVTSDSIKDSELVLFYLSRINNKLDNLGQLRHLNTILKYVREQSLYENDKRRARESFLFDYYVALSKTKKVKPGMEAARRYVSYLTIEEIDAIFENVDVNR